VAPRNESGNNWHAWVESSQDGCSMRSLSGLVKLGEASRPVGK
jgi:hypothetical protein